MTPGGGDVLIVTGARNGQPFRKEIDVAAMFLKNNFDDDIIVAGGDLLDLRGSSHPVFYIYGEVQRPAPLVSEGHDSSPSLRPRAAARPHEERNGTLRSFAGMPEGKV